MKKVLLIFIIGVMFITVNVYSKSRFSVTVDNIEKDLDLYEELEPIYDDDIITGFNINIEIPSNYSKDEIVISPSIFEGINNYKHLVAGEEVFINIKLINHSKYNYSYKDNSFMISTVDLLENSKNYTSIGEGFDGNLIASCFSINRVYNEAIKDLYNDNYKEQYLTSDKLDNKLRNNGYSLDLIDKYILDYYNNKYNLNTDDLNSFTYSVIKDIYSGKIGLEKEVNKNIISLAYNYYYNKLLYVLLDDIQIDEFESDKYSIGSYMKNSDLRNTFKYFNIDSGSSYDINMRVGINKYYYSEVFNDYNLYGKVSFVLEKSDYVVVPNTGVSY